MGDQLSGSRRVELARRLVAQDPGHWFDNRDGSWTHLDTGDRMWVESTTGFQDLLVRVLDSGGWAGDDLERVAGAVLGSLED